MKETYQTRLRAALSRLLACLPANAEELTHQFTGQFFAKMTLADLEDLTPQEACAIAASALSFMQEREKGVPKIRIFSPTLAAHGWESHRLVIELINDDMPFLVDSLSAELTRQGFSIYETIHPIFSVKRDNRGRLAVILPEGEKGVQESFIHFELSPLPAERSAEDVKAGLERCLAHVRLAVEDWPQMIEKTRSLGRMLPHAAGHANEAEIHEAQDFLEWLIDKNFIFLGHAAIGYGKQKSTVLADSLLGVSRLDLIAGEVRSTDHLIEVRKSDRRALVHRPALMDVVVVKTLSPKGEVIGEHRLYGLFTSTVYYHSVDDIPLVRRKVARVTEASGFDPVSHDGKALKAIMEFLPRDEIFQLSEEELLDMGLGILSLEAKPAVRMFARQDVARRFVSCMVFVPREYFSTELRKQIARILEQAYHASLESFTTQITESPLARVHMLLRGGTEETLPVDTRAVEAEIANVTTLWGDRLRAAMLARFGEERSEELYRRYASAFPAAYVNRYDLSSTLHDIEKTEQCLQAGGLALELYRDKQEDEKFLHLKIYNPQEEIALSDILPSLEHMGMKAIEEHPYPVTVHGAAPVWIRDFKLTPTGGESVEMEAVKPRFEEALLKAWRREIEDDRFNGLTLRAGLSARQVEMLRAYAKYLKQINFTYGQTAIAAALNAYPELARLLVDYFEGRFNPALTEHEQHMHAIQERFTEQLSEVSGIAEDKILRTLMEVMTATLRTNYFQLGADGAPKPVISFKFHSASVPELPLPKPYAEIFVYSARVEGIHLRGGKVARGGLRWSDRAEDFRTEVLGLVKAQMVKNAVIVPVGSKGGFIVKQPPAGGREAFQQEGVQCYTLYLQGLLDITDNIVHGEVIPPKDTVRHDGDDPYLVVAADKGTASFSDIANAVSNAYGFWLGDAFASGGSAGYDHKKMAITARGGWVSVTRHFREMGVDIAKEEFTCVGIGDMSGDVFGNGMLLSDNIRLIAAFNHLHIFIDPNPNAKKSFEERKRLFYLPRSGWADYNEKLISRGGGIYERSAKRIALSPEAREALGIPEAELAPDALIKAILKAPVDLLWNGGIGTYVKAEEETHDQVGDRANNGVRVNGRELRCKVVGEGGNLGFTQKGRIEYARAGGRINTDAIDNSGGVDCSDHEVNIKIALQAAMADGKLGLEARNQLLADMTEEVAALVLKDNQLQTQAISMAEQRGAQLLESQTRLMQAMERQGLLDRAIEFLPSDKTLSELKLAGRGLTRPELAVLLAYSKIMLTRELVESSLPDEPYFTHDLVRYFPKAMREPFGTYLNRHPLKREIIATVATNSLVNRAGITFFHDLAEDTGLPAREIATAYTVARDAFGLRSLWNAMETASSVIPIGVQAQMHASVAELLARVSLWLLRHVSHPLPVEELMQKFGPSVQAYREALPHMHSDATRKAYEKQLGALMEQGVPDTLAHSIAALEMLGSACDVIKVANEVSLPIATVGQAYFSLGSKLKLGWLRHYAGKIETKSHWERLAVQSLVHELFDEQRRLTLQVVQLLCQEGACDTDAVAAWIASHSEEAARYQRFLEDLRTHSTFDVSVLMVALKHVKMLG